MKVYFNNVGVITSTDFTGDSLRQGSVGVTLKAYFSGINNANYTALLNFTRSNGTSVSGIRMELDASNSECYNYKFDDPWFFAKAGTTTLTIFLHDAGGNVIAQGQVQFSIEATDYDDDPDITVSQYNELITMIEEVESSGEMNVLEGVQVNGVDLPIDANKKVNVDISGKVDKVTGKGLSKNDFTDAYKNKLDGIEANANANVIDGIKVKDATTTTLTPDANKDVTIDISAKANKASDSVDGNLASLDENGNLEDSGYAASKIGELDNRVDALETIGRFLSLWNADTGVAVTNPPHSPYTYQTGDYFRVSVGGTKIVTGSSYVIGSTNYTTSATTLGVGDVLYYDGTNWQIQIAGSGGQVVDVQVNGQSVIQAGVAKIKNLFPEVSSPSSTTLSQDEVDAIIAGCYMPNGYTALTGTNSPIVFLPSSPNTADTSVIESAQNYDGICIYENRVRNYNIVYNIVSGLKISFKNVWYKHNITCKVGGVTYYTEFIDDHVAYSVTYGMTGNLAKVFVGKLLRTNTGDSTKGKCFQVLDYKHPNSSLYSLYGVITDFTSSPYSQTITDAGIVSTDFSDTATPIN